MRENGEIVCQGQLGLNEEFIHEGPIGTTFRGKLIKEEKVGDFKGVVPRITGEAFITGFNHYGIFI